MPLFLLMWLSSKGLASLPDPLCPHHRELVVRRAGDVKQEESMRNADTLPSESHLAFQPPVPGMFFHALRHLGKRCWC